MSNVIVVLQYINGCFSLYFQTYTQKLPRLPLSGGILVAIFNCVSLHQIAKRSLYVQTQTLNPQILIERVSLPYVEVKHTWKYDLFFNLQIAPNYLMKLKCRTKIKWIKIEVNKKVLFSLYNR